MPFSFVKVGATDDKLGNNGGAQYRSDWRGVYPVNPVYRSVTTSKYQPRPAFEPEVRLPIVKPTPVSILYL